MLKISHSSSINSSIINFIRLFNYKLEQVVIEEKVTGIAIMVAGICKEVRGITDFVEAFNDREDEEDIMLVLVTEKHTYIESVSIENIKDAFEYYRKNR